MDIVVSKLTQGGFDVVAVPDGVAALAAIEADPPRLAVLDIQMPGISGLEVLRQIRANGATEDLDVILLTAFAKDSEVDTGFEAGANDYITKPFSMRELLQRVKAVLARGDR